MSILEVPQVEVALATVFRSCSVASVGRKFSSDCIWWSLPWLLRLDYGVTRSSLVS